VFQELRDEKRRARDEFARRDVETKRTPLYEEARIKILRSLVEGTWTVTVKVTSPRGGDDEYDFDQKTYWVSVDDFPPVTMALRSPRMRAEGRLLAWPVEAEPARGLKGVLGKLDHAEVAFTVAPLLGSVRPLAYRFCTTTACYEWVPWLPAPNPSCPSGGCAAAP